MNLYFCPRMVRRTIILLLGVVGGIGSVTRAMGGEIDAGAGYMWEHSNNVLRVPTNEQSESIHTLVAGLGYLETTPEFSGRALLQADYRNYQRDLLADETIYTADASGIWSIVPQRLSWTAEDAYRQVLLNITQPDVPTNRANSNVFSTGPDIIFPVGTVDTLALGARYANMYVSGTSLDNERYSTRASWRHLSSPTTELSLNHEATQVNYVDSNINPNFRSDSLFFHFQTRPSQSQYLLDYGVTRSRRDGSDEVEGRLARLSWTRQSTPEVTIGASYSEEFQDTGSALLSTITSAPDPSVPSVPSTTAPAPVATTTTIVAASDVAYTKRAEVFYNEQQSNFGMNVVGFRREIEYQVSLQDRDERGGSLELSYRSSLATRWILFGNYQKTDYLDLDRRDIDRTGGLRLVSAVTPNVRWGVEFSQVERFSSDPAARFVDDRILFFVYYTTGPLYTPLGR
jgi:hypothetical protein